MMKHKKYKFDIMFLTIKDPQTGLWVVSNPMIFDDADLNCSGEGYSLFTKEEVKKIESSLNSLGK